MKKILIPMLALFALPLFGQNLQDAFRLMSQDHFSTARTAGVGAAFGAMGADFGALGINPATAGAYRTGELNFSFSGNQTYSDALLDGADTGDYARSKRRLKFDHVGLVFNSRPMGSDWTATNFAFGFNRVANFDQQVYWSGETKGSFTDRFLERANGKELSGLDDFEGGLAFDVGAIYGPDNQLYYSSDYQLYPNNLLDKSQTIRSTGGINEMVFAYGANFREKLLFGVSIGVPFLNYNEEKSYEETALPGDLSILQQLEYNESLSISGVGFNFKAGVIGLLGKYLRLGASVHSPSFFTLQDDYFNEMYYEFDEGNGPISYQDGSPDGYFKYRFATPWRFIGSAGILIDLGDVQGFVDFDAEYTDFSTGKFNFTEYSNDIGDRENEREQNQNIALQLRPAMSYRIGAELAYKKVRARAGYSLRESIFTNDSFGDSSPVLSLGTGYRGRSFFLDVAWVHSSHSYGYSPYELVEFEKEQFVDIDKRTSKLIFTFGTKF